MVWPFLSVILIRDFHLHTSEIGMILGGSSLAGSTTGFYLGNLSDRFGRRTFVIFGCIGSIAAFLILSSANSFFLCTLDAMLVGLCRAAIETPGSALIAESIQEQHLRELAFHGRYFLANVGASVGPLIGFLFGLATQQTTFLFVAAAYSVFGIFLLWGFRSTLRTVPANKSDEARLSRTLRRLNDDRRFLVLIVASFIAYFAYAQVESTLVQYLNLEGGDAGVGLATAIIMTNGITIIVFQFPLLRLLRSYDLYIRIQAGMALFITGFLIYAMLPTGLYGGWIFATWIVSLGEAILFPTLNLQADRMAPAHLKGSYFGATTLSGLGLAVGPSLGGVMLQYLGGPSAFLLTATITAIGGLCYWQSSRRAEPDPGSNLN
jgi:MFS family permease